MNKRRERYCNLGSMSGVQAELAKLRRMKRTNLKHIEEDWEDIRYALSPSNLLQQAMGRLACRSSFFGNILAGVHAASGLFRSRDKHGSCGCE